jgi:UDPglucose 6-dehydrogenase
MNVDVVTNALKNSTDRIMGPKYMSAGLGDGGGCHPRDNIALRSLALELDLGYDLFDAIMLAREKQALNMAKIIKGLAHRVCILGSGFKPGVLQQEGSPAILLGYQLEQMMKLYEHSIVLWYDKHPKEVTEPLTYVMHDHDKFKDFDFNQDSVIFDPFGKTEQTSDLTKKGITVYNYGRGALYNYA